MAGKTTLRHAFEAAKVNPANAQSSLVKRVVNVMARGSGIKQSHRRKPRK